MLMIIFIIFLFALLVILHEFGHFVTAKRGGVEVEEFGIGFPPKLWGRKVRGTLYSINLLPLGGFVRMRGEDDGVGEPGTFGAASLGTKTVILLAGVVMNLLTAIVLVYVLCVTGIPALSPQFEPKFVTPTFAQPKQLILTQVVAGSPAAGVGLKRGDYVLRADGQKMETDDQLRAFTKAHAGKEVTLHVRSNGDERDVAVKLRDPGSTQQGYLGAVSQQVYKLRYSPLEAIPAALYIVGALLVATIVGVFQLLVSIPALLLGLFSHSVPQAAQAASGPLGIIFVLKSMSSLGMSYVFLIVANIAVALAAFNVLPIPALDGGRLALLWVQKAMKRPLNPETEAKIHAIGFIALIALMLLVTIYDLRKFF